MGNKRRPMAQSLPAKLLAVREVFNASQNQIADALSVEVAAFNLNCGRISEYEHNKREPNMLVLLAYARLAGITVELIIDDRVDMAQFRKALAKKARFIEKQRRRLIKPVEGYRHPPQFN